MRDFIITSLQSWDIEIGSTIKNTALEISRQNRVLYVNPPMDAATRVRLLTGKAKPSPIHRRQLEVLREKASPLRSVHPNLWVSDCPFLIHSVGQLPTFLFNLLNRKNGQKIGQWISEQAATLGFKDYVHLIDTDLFRSLHLKEFLRPAISIYYRRDYVIGFPYWRKHGPRCEEKLVRRSDIVLANSSYFAKQLRPLNPNTHVLNTGVNLELYDAARHWEKPADLQAVPSPVIGYTGALIASRLDSDLLYKVAARLPEYNFVLVGPEDGHFRNHALHRLKNVHFTGRKEVEELPRYIRHFDVCINPQTVNDITDGNYPLKIDEYLAMGKPVVATSTHTMREVFAAHTHLATSAEEWVAALQTAAGESGDAALAETRIAFAHTHSWEESVKSIYRAIEKYQQKQLSCHRTFEQSGKCPPKDSQGQIRPSLYQE